MCAGAGVQFVDTLLQGCVDIASVDVACIYKAFADRVLPGLNMARASYGVGVLHAEMHARCAAPFVALVLSDVLGGALAWEVGDHPAQIRQELVEAWMLLRRTGTEIRFIEETDMPALLAAITRHCIALRTAALPRVQGSISRPGTYARALLPLRSTAQASAGARACTGRALARAQVQLLNAVTLLAPCLAPASSTLATALAELPAILK